MRRARIISGIFLVAMVATTSFAQVAPIDSDLIDRAIDTQRQTVPSVSQPAPRPDPSGGIEVAPPPVLTAEADGPCFDITVVVITGWEPTGLRPSAADTLVDKCIFASDVADSVTEINVFYQQVGLSTTRAYLPEQDLSDGTIEIVVLPGRIEAIVPKDGTAATSRLRLAFPTAPGDILQLRDLEQGFDNLSRPGSTTADLTLIPGTNPGETIVAVDLVDARPWHLETTLSNDGKASTGEVRAGLEFEYDNLFNLNDTLTITVGTSLPDDITNRVRYADSGSLAWSVPIGLWSHDFYLSASEYRFPVEGTNQTYDLTGDSLSFVLESERLLFRDQVVKVFARGGIERSFARSFIDDIELESQRRNTTVGVLGLRGERVLTQGEASWDVALRFGLDALGASIEPDATIDQTFMVIETRFELTRALNAGGTRYQGELVGRWSNDTLPSSEQISFGGWSTVRGFDDDSLYGNHGVYLRNTLSGPGPTVAGRAVQVDLGLDAGYVGATGSNSWVQNYLIGTSVGVALALTKGSTLRLEIAQALSRPEVEEGSDDLGFSGDSAVARVELSVVF